MAGVSQRSLLSRDKEFSSQHSLQNAQIKRSMAEPQPLLRISLYFQIEQIEGRLRNLSELKEKGLIDEEEYSARRQKILDEV